MLGSRCKRGTTSSPRSLPTIRFLSRRGRALGCKSRVVARQWRRSTGASVVCVRDLQRGSERPCGHGHLSVSTVKTVVSTVEMALYMAEMAMGEGFVLRGKRCWVVGAKEEPRRRHGRYRRSGSCLDVGEPLDANQGWWRDNGGDQPARLLFASHDTCCLGLFVVLLFFFFFFFFPFFYLRDQPADPRRCPVLGKQK